MVARRACARWARWSAAALFVSIAVADPAPASTPQEQQTQLRAFLDAGEFAPALDLARRATDSKQRDALLVQIVQAQASAGARAASVLSASEITDDRARKRALDGRGPAAARHAAAPPSPISIRSST